MCSLISNVLLSTCVNYLKKEVQNPTIRWIYSMFINVDRMVTDDKSICVRLSDFQRRTVKILRDELHKMYQVFLE
jgi:hypothetical protein